jgi:hypothetical protein
LKKSLLVLGRASSCAPGTLILLSMISCSPP